MRKLLIVITLLVMSVFTSCNGYKEYCSACEKEICTINNELYVQYGLRNLAYDKMMSDTLTYKEFESWSYTYKRADAKIEELEEIRKYFELDILKYSKNYEYSTYTKDTYDMIDSLIWRNDIPDVPGAIKPVKLIDPLH